MPQSGIGKNAGQRADKQLVSGASGRAQCRSASSHRRRSLRTPAAVRQFDVVQEQFDVVQEHNGIGAGLLVQLKVHVCNSA